MCTRILYETSDQNFLVGRTLDWEEDPRTNLWAFPAGQKRDGGVGVGSITWTALYGSVVAAVYVNCKADGINSEGLVANLLYLSESDFGQPKGSGKPLLSVGAWTQYVLDNYATVSEAVLDLATEPFVIVTHTIPTMQFPNGRPASVHLTISDRNGDSAILEYVGGKLRIYHDASFTVITNSPTFDKQMAIASYWDSIGGASFLPGGVRSADRFTRMRWMLNQVPKAADSHTATATVLSLMRAISVPLGLRDPDLPNISSTRWRTVFDSSKRRLFFEAVYSPHIFWVDLDHLPLQSGPSALQLALSGTGDQGNPMDWALSGEVSQSFKAATAYSFLAPPH